MSLGGLKGGVKELFAKPAVWHRLGPLTRPPGVIVLTYHDVFQTRGPLEGMRIDLFAEQMRWVRDHCEPIEPEAVVERSRDARRSRPAVLVTFDDGYRSYHDLAYPVLKELGIPALVFVATSFMDEGGMMWTDQVQRAAAASTIAELDVPWSGERVPLPDAAARKALGARARAHLKTLPDTERRAQMKTLLAALGASPHGERTMLTWDEVRRTMDLTRYGGHSHTHPILSRLDTATARHEIETCHARVTAETGRAPKHFAYPNGGPHDFTTETKEIVRASGFEIAFSTTVGIAGPDTDWLAVKRIGAGEMSMAGFAWTMAGLNRS
ncbi:MAG TPA: polysaccharide deacetylase family protein [Polyangia bacterium]|nr:polysaccharide deacetylase family protein [Polyangia bacterium]